MAKPLDSWNWFVAWLPLPDNVIDGIAVAAGVGALVGAVGGI
jgi:hypothetical protein